MRLSNDHCFAAFSLCSAWLLSACGGGGGASSIPSPSMYSVGGSLSGLTSSASVVLQNGGNSTTVSANGSFSFATLLANSAAYAVTVLTQPTGQTCTVTSGSGAVTGANVTSVQVTCANNTYTISGTVSGLNSGAQVTVQNNASDPTAVKANGSFSFATSVSYNGSYLVTVSTQPLAETCTVSAGTGSGVTANVAGVSVACVPTTEKVIHTFDANLDGLFPIANIFQSGDGSFYGTTQQGGTNNLGTVFKITPAGVETVLYSFAGGTTDGSGPTAALIQGNDGNFYGTTQSGGTNGNGTVFKITPAGIETVLHSFTGADGGVSTAALVQGGDGNFYGTTQQGGTNNLGTVFKITPAGVEAVLYSFAGGTTDGSHPSAALIQGNDGNFYGTTQGGGMNDNGTVFRITPAGIETVLHSFTGVDGDLSFAALVQGGDGNFYGTTQRGGASAGGTVFKITPAGVETVLYSFVGGPTDGSYPTAALIQGNDGNFYGTTQGGGMNDNGTVFRITPAGIETVLHSFTGADGGFSFAALVQGDDGNFYATTNSGGTSGAGTVFKITPAGVVTVVYAFKRSSEGQSPVGLIQGRDGNFYGTTYFGGMTGGGTMFKITPTGIETTLYSFGVGPGDGRNPNAALTEGSDGNFYGTTASGGTSSAGTVFKITPTGVETIMYSFEAAAPDARNPSTALIQGSDGNFYGTTNQGGTSFGTVFKITPDGAETVLYSFGGYTYDGGFPFAALIQGSDGNFYGTTSAGGTSGMGTVFKITPTGVETVLYSFTGGNDGSPFAALIQGSDGNFYGTTFSGGASNHGTVFKITSAGVETTLYSFAGGLDGNEPAAALIQGSDGNFYGTTQQGGANGAGTVFTITPAGAEMVLHSFTGGADGTNPNAALIQGSDGNFYGTTERGGTSNQGTVFEF